MSSSSSKPKNNIIRPVILASTIFIVVTSVFAWLFFKSIDQVQLNAQNIFDEEQFVIKKSIESRKDIYLNSLYAARGLFSASNNVTEQEWKYFVEELDLANRFPGIQGLGYGAFIFGSEKQDFISMQNTVRDEDASDFEIFPKGTRDFYNPVIYIQPSTGTNPDSIGLDMLFEPSRKNAIFKAIETNSLQNSGKVFLQQKNNIDSKPGFVVYLPVYKKPQTENYSIESIQGIILAGFQVENFIDTILKNQNSNLDITIYDNEQKEESIIYQSNNTESQNKNFKDLKTIETINIANRNWIIEFTPKNNFGENILNTSVPWYILFGGISLAFLISCVVYLIAYSQKRAQFIAIGMTKDLLYSKIKAEIETEKMSAIISSIGDGIVVVDNLGSIVLVNNSFTNLTGWKKDDVIGKNMTEILPLYNKAGKLVKESERPINKALLSKKSTNNKFQNIEYAKKDGSTFPVAITVSPVTINTKLAGAVQVFRDITKEYEVDKAKTEFVSLASHQLRTPLTSIAWYTEMLLSINGKNLTENQQLYVKEIQNGSKRMVELVNALLNVSRIELGNFAVDPIPENPKEILDNVIKDMRILLEEKEVTYTIDTSQSPKIYIADKNLLGMIFQNLISNAFKYTHTGTINISLKENHQWLEFIVADTGLGIPEDQQKKIFAKLFRGDNVKTHDTTGTGLGLYIIKAIVEEVGGTIQFKSKLNMGTTFTVRLPLSGMKSKSGSRPLES